MVGTSRTERQSEAVVLAQIGTALARADLPPVAVTLPRALAEQAVAAWERHDDATAVAETPAQRRQRHHAGTLALIGLAIQERGRWHANSVTVELTPGIIGLALDAADG